MSTIRFGIVGIGNMGSHHLAYLSKGEIQGGTVGAICDTDPAKLDRFTKQYNVPGFATHKEMLASGQIDAVLIATPHYDHMPILVDSMAAGKHVLCEKPAAVTVKAARIMNDTAAKHPNLKFGIMFQQRTSPIYQKMRELIADGELGEITRISWLITDWFRTWSYYASGGWRATWKGEGGGVLINQCPHNLDLMQWVTGGMVPNRVTAVGFIGKQHPIEVEDEISAILEYPNGAIGHFVTTTGEAPGTNRFEVVGDRGKLVAEQGKLLFYRTRKSVREIREKDPRSFVNVETWPIEVPAPGKSSEHRAITQNFVNAILNDEPLLAPGTEGVKGLEIGNAMLMAGITRTPVELPMDGDAYERFLLEMAEKYGGRKTLDIRAAQVDMSASFK